MNEGLIARRYAKALLKYAQEKDKTFPVYEAARQVEASFIAHLDLQEAMLNPVLTASQKEALMLSAAGVDAASFAVAGTGRLFRVDGTQSFRLCS